jgi:hypothetical protein
MSLTEVLPVEPVIPTTGQPSSRRHSVATSCSERSGSGALTQGAGTLGREDRTPGPRLERAAGELAAVGVLAPEPEEQIARIDLV